MKHIFRPPAIAIEEAVVRLKRDGVVHPEAEFNCEAENGLRREIAYGDDDLQYRLGRSPVETEIVEAAVALLKKLELVPSDAAYDKLRFDSFRREIKTKFKGSWTSISPVMERLLYVLTCLHRPQHLVELGSFWGNTLAWFAGPCVGVDPVYDAARIIGIDIDREITVVARDNFARLDNADRVELIGEDAATALECVDGRIDFLYLEAKDDADNSSYLTFLRQAYSKLPSGAWVIAHDTTAWGHQDDLRGYLSWVRDEGNFQHSISFDVDRYGLELSIK